MSNQRKNGTYGMVKPYSDNDWENDAVQTVILEEFQSQLKALGLEVKVMHEIRYDKDHIAKHYHEHFGRPYYGKLEDCLLTNKAIGMIITDKDNSPAVVDSLRSVAGSTLKVDKETGTPTRIHEPGTIRYNLAFTIYQMKNGAKREDVVIPANVDHCKLVFNQDAERVDIFEGDRKIGEMFMTQNFIHTSSSIEDANNEINTFLSQYEANKEKNLHALMAHAKSKAPRVK